MFFLGCQICPRLKAILFVKFIALILISILLQKSAKMTEEPLTVDMGPEKLDRVPEHLLKKRKEYQGMKRKDKEIARQRKKLKATPTLQFKRAEHFLRAAKLSSRDSIRVDRNLRKLITKTDTKKMVPVENVKLIAVVRIRTADGIG